MLTALGCAIATDVSRLALSQPAVGWMMCYPPRRTKLAMVEQRRDILLVDDTLDNLRVLSTILTEQGYKVRKVTSGALALKVIQASPPDLILLDVMMPEMNGYDVCRRLKATPEYARIPVIFISALDDALDKVEAFSVGGADYISKPFQSLEVVARVDHQFNLLQLQTQLQTQNEALQQEVATRQAAQKTLENTLRMREDLSNMLVHDLRNPVTTILMICESLTQRGIADLRSRQRLDIMHETSRRLHHLIDDLLVVAKMDAGKLLLHATAVDGNQLVMNAVDALKVMAESRCELVIDLPANSQLLHIDANLISRVLDNLVANAIKFSPAKSQVTIQLEYADPGGAAEGQQARFRVMDNGPGLSAEQQQSIFERFEVGQPVQGMAQVGLGLAFCKMVAEAHGGQIFVEPNHPQGSIFTVVI